MLNHNEVSPLLVCEKVAAKLIGVSAAMLVAGRFQKRPLLPFVRVGSRTIRYRVADINDFIDRNTDRTAAPPLQQAAERHGVSKSVVHRAVADAENPKEGQPPPPQAAEGEAAVGNTNSSLKIPDFPRRSPGPA